MDGFWFTSTLFSPHTGDGTRQLAAWLATELEKHGYGVEPAIEEDWGYCLVLRREPFLFWVGCGAVDSPAALDADSRNTRWHCFPAADVPLMRRLLGKPDVGTALAKLRSDLHAILAGEPQIALTAEPSV